MCCDKTNNEEAKSDNANNTKYHDPEKDRMLAYRNDVSQSINSNYHYFILSQTMLIVLLTTIFNDENADKITLMFSTAFGIIITLFGVLINHRRNTYFNKVKDYVYQHCREIGDIKRYCKLNPLISAHSIMTYYIPYIMLIVWIVLFFYIRARR